MVSLDIIDFFSKPVKIDLEWVNSSCKYNKGEKQCIFLSIMQNNFYCVKNTSLKKVIGKEFESMLVNRPNSGLAEGDNCSGLSEFDSFSEDELALAY